MRIQVMLEQDWARGKDHTLCENKTPIKFMVFWPFRDVVEKIEKLLTFCSHDLDLDQDWR